MALRSFISAAVACGALLGAVVTRADEVEDLVEQGVALRKQHRNEEALEVFRRAHALAPSPRTRAQIGLAEQAIGRWIEAERDLEASLAATTDPWVVKNRTALEASLESVRDRLGWLDVKSTVTPAELYVDGKMSGSLPLAEPLRVAAGTAVIEVRKTGYVTVKRGVFVHARVIAHEQVLLVQVESAPVAIPAPPVKPPSDSVPSTSRFEVLPTTLVAVGVGAVAVGAYFGVRTFVLKSQRNEHCEGGACDDIGLSLHDQARTAATISTIAIGAGLAAVTTGIMLWPRPPKPNTVAVRSFGLGVLAEVQW